MILTDFFIGSITMTAAAAMAVIAVAGRAAFVAHPGVPVGPADSGSVARFASVAVVMLAVAAGAVPCHAGVAERGVPPIRILVAHLAGAALAASVVCRPSVGMAAGAVGGGRMVHGGVPAGVAVAALAVACPAVGVMAAGSLAGVAGVAGAANHLVILGMRDPGPGPEAV